MRAENIAFHIGSPLEQFCSQCNEPQITTSLGLSTIWHVYADRTYDVRPGGWRTTTIVLRTLEGCGDLQFDSQSVRATQNSLVLFPHQTIRRYRCSGERWHFWWFECTMDTTFRVFPFFTLFPITASASETHLMQNAFSLLRKNIPAAHMLASAHLQLLLNKWHYDRESYEFPDHPHRPVVESVIELMYTNYKTLTVSDMAHKACLSRRRFSQVFREVTGSSPKSYYDTLRLSMAKEMLRTTSLTLAQIAERYGFSSNFHFSKAFRNYFGVPPSEYRKGKKANYM